MQNTILKKPICSPADRELVECVKKAACQHYGIEEAILFEDSTPAVANIRFLCFWLIMNNTELKDYSVGQAFHKSRSSVLYGVDLIQAHKNIYSQTLDNLRHIARIANNFEKNSSWHIQTTNIRL